MGSWARPPSRFSLPLGISQFTSSRFKYFFSCSENAKHATRWGRGSRDGDATKAESSFGASASNQHSVLHPMPLDASGGLRMFKIRRSFFSLPFSLFFLLDVSVPKRRPFLPLFFVSSINYCFGTLLREAGLYFPQSIWSISLFEHQIPFNSIHTISVSFLS